MQSTNMLICIKKLFCHVNAAFQLEVIEHTVLHLPPGPFQPASLSFRAPVLVTYVDHIVMSNTH